MVTAERVLNANQHPALPALYCCPTDMTLAPDKAVAGADKAAVFAAEVAKATQKLPVVTGEILNISLKDFADLFCEETAPFSYKW